VQLQEIYPSQQEPCLLKQFAENCFDLYLVLITKSLKKKDIKEVFFFSFNCFSLIS